MVEAKYIHRRYTVYKTYNCIVCNKECRLTYSKNNIFCSNPCHQKKRRQDLIDSWLSGGEKSIWKFNIPAWAKEYLIEARGHKCEMCNCETHRGEPIPLEVDHINGDHTNNDLTNLRIICPNCHSQTDTYKNRNKGNGRMSRRKNITIDE